MACNRTRLCAAALCCAILFTSCGSTSPTSNATVPVSGATSSDSAPETLPSKLILGYSPGAGFNPYLVPSNLVAQNAGLLFEPLVQLTPDMTLEYRLASAIQCAGEMVLLQIRPGCTFADGTPISAADAAASLQAAKDSAMYGPRFANVQQITVKDDIVEITLEKPDSMFAYLCDIPVLKAADIGSTTPTASGRYTYGSGTGSLVRNERCPFPENCPESISLTEVSSYEEMVSGLAVGSLNLYASNTADGSPGFSSRAEYYKTNNLVFIGINAATQDTQKSPLLAAPAGRSLLSQIINRRNLAEKSFYSRAYPATGLINGYYECVRENHHILAENELTPDAAHQQLEALGYTLDPATGYYQDAKGQRLSVRLTVYGGSTYKRYAAALLKEQFADCGLYLELDEVSDFDAYAQKIAVGDFDLYIGEVKLYNNMDISPFLEGGQASAGIVQSEALLAAYDAFKADQNAADTFEEAFAAEMPLIPLVWRTGTVVHGRNISGLSSSISNIFYSLEGLEFEQAP